MLPAAGPGEAVEEAPRLLLLYLADRRRAAHPASASARTFLLCQAFAEEVINLQASCQLMGGCRGAWGTGEGAGPAFPGLRAARSWLVVSARTRCWGPLVNPCSLG